ncbi:MAG: hypothetical protein WA139_02565 [Candidatus Aenigmatarchaeota archaeon]
MNYSTNVPKNAEPDCDDIQYQKRDSITETQIKPRLSILKRELGKISDADPEIIEAGEKLHKILHHIGWQRLYRSFII